MSKLKKSLLGLLIAAPKYINSMEANINSQTTAFTEDEKIFSILRTANDYGLETRKTEKGIVIPVSYGASQKIALNHIPSNLENKFKEILLINPELYIKIIRFECTDLGPKPQLNFIDTSIVDKFYKPLNSNKNISKSIEINTFEGTCLVIGEIHSNANVEKLIFNFSICKNLSYNIKEALIILEISNIPSEPVIDLLKNIKHNILKELSLKNLINVSKEDQDLHINRILKDFQYSSLESLTLLNNAIGCLTVSKVNFPTIKFLTISNSSNASYFIRHLNTITDLKIINSDVEILNIENHKEMENLEVYGQDNNFTLIVADNNKLSKVKANLTKESTCHVIEKSPLSLELNRE